MKYLVSQLTYFFQEPEVRKNVGALVKYLLFLAGVILAFTVIFHLLMVHVEKQQHSWLTGFYWTLTVMSTLGFGDITFHSDIGRAFSIVVLLSGVVLLLIMLPFTFIRYFYAPWLEAQLRLQAPRSVPPETENHVIICRYESTCRGVIRKLNFNKIPYFVIEPDPVVAARGAVVRAVGTPRGQGVQPTGEARARSRAALPRGGDSRRRAPPSPHRTGCVARYPRLDPVDAIVLHAVFRQARAGQSSHQRAHGAARR